MKNKITSILKIAFVLFAVIAITSSCTKDKWYNSIEIYHEPFTIKNTAWTWNGNLSRYEYVKQISSFNLKDYMYDDGVISASVFLNEGNVEVQTPLPYIRSWIDKASGKTYTETLSFDISYDDNSILYYVQESDMSKKDQRDFPDYEIKVSVISYK